MNKSIPIIAIQLNAIKHGDAFFLNSVKVLDLTESGDEEEPEIQEKVEREDWAKWANPESMGLFDALVGIVKTIGEPKVTYNSGHIAVRTAGQNFMWCCPRKAANVFLVIRVGEENRDSMVAQFEEQGIECVKAGRKINNIKVWLTPKDFEKNKNLIRDTILMAENFSR